MTTTPLKRLKAVILQIIVAWGQKLVNVKYISRKTVHKKFEKILMAIKQFAARNQSDGLSVDSLIRKNSTKPAALKEI